MAPILSLRLTLGDLPVSEDLLNTCYSLLQQSRDKPAQSQEIQTHKIRVKSETSPRSLRPVTDLFCFMLTLSVVGTFIYSDILSDS